MIIDQMEIKARHASGTKAFNRVPEELKIDDNGILEEFAVFVTFKKVQRDRDNRPHIELFLNDQKFGLIQLINDSPIAADSRIAEIHVKEHRMQSGIKSLKVSVKPQRGEPQSQTLPVV